MSVRAQAFEPQRIGQSWWLVAAIGLVVIAAGYLVSANPEWLAIDLDPTNATHLLVVLLGGLVAMVLLRWPQVGAFALVALVFTNASEVGVRFHSLPSLLQGLLPLLVLTLLARRVSLKGQRWTWDPLVGWLVVYGMILFASSARAVSPVLADEALFEYLRSFTIIVCLINLVTSAKTFRRTVWALVLAGAFLGTISVYQVLTSSYSFDYWGFGQIKQATIVGHLLHARITGSLSDPNFYAQTLAVLVPLALYRLWDESSLRLKVIAAYALGVITLALFFTYSRGGALAIGIVLILAVLHKWVHSHTTVLRPRLPGVGVNLRMLWIGLLVLVPLWLFVPKEFGGRLETLKQLLPGGQASIVHVDTSFQQRRLVMGAAQAMWADYPWLGVGVGNYPAHYNEYAARIGSFANSYENFDKRRLPHSLYLEVAAETGAIGFGVFAIIIGSTLLAFHRASRHFRSCGDAVSANLATSLSLGFIGYLTTSLFLHGDYMRYFWVLVALAIAARHIATQRSLNPARS